MTLVLKIFLTIEWVAGLSGLGLLILGCVTDEEDVENAGLTCIVIVFTLGMLYLFMKVICLGVKALWT